MGAGGAVRRVPSGHVPSLAELGVREGVVGKFEGPREVAAQPAVEGVGDDAGGDEAQVVEVGLLGRGERVGVAGGAAVEVGEQRQLTRGVDVAELFRVPQGVQPFEVGQTGHDRASQREDAVRRARGRGASVGQVDAGFHAFVADPVGVASESLVIRQSQLGQADEAARLGAAGGG